MEILMKAKAQSKHKVKEVKNCFYYFIIFVAENEHQFATKHTRLIIIIIENTWEKLNGCRAWQRSTNLHQKTVIIDSNFIELNIVYCMKSMIKFVRYKYNVRQTGRQLGLLSWFTGGRKLQSCLFGM